jgi:translation initiation factor 2-alpha kinase 4
MINLYFSNKLGNLGLLFLTKAIMKMVELKRLTFEISNNLLSDEGINNSLPLLADLI